MSDAAGAPGYRPWPAVLFIAAVLALPMALRYDTGHGAPETLSLAVAEAGGGGWLGDFGTRLFVSPFKIVLAWGVLVSLVYGLAQILALGADRRQARAGSAWPGAAVPRFLSGRARTGGTGYLHITASWGADTLLGPLRLGVTLFPMLGFIGTVVGLSEAIRNLPAAVKDQDQLQPVLDDLYVAFDTTFLGLVGALVCLIAVRLAEPHIDALLRDAP